MPGIDSLEYRLEEFIRATQWEHGGNYEMLARIIATRFIPQNVSKKASSKKQKKPTAGR